MKRFLRHRELTSVFFLILLFLIVGVINPSFLKPGNIIACFNDAVVYIIISVGMAFAIFIGEIDVSVGANLGFTATVVGTMLRDGSNWGAAFAAGILVGLLVCVLWRKLGRESSTVLQKSVHRQGIRSGPAEPCDYDSGGDCDPFVPPKNKERKVFYRSR